MTIPSDEQKRFVGALSEQIDGALNGSDEVKGIGFILLLFPMAAPPEAPCTITSNVHERDRVAKVLEIQAAKMNGPMIIGDVIS